MFETVKFSFQEAHWIVITVLALYTWFINKQSASAKEMLDIRLRVVELENAVKDMPSKLEIARLEGEIKSINQQLNSTSKSIEAVQRGVNRIEQYLLDNKK
jgi:predicted  nucleic acid-binding Zn-ribbon protein